MPFGVWVSELGIKFKAPECGFGTGMNTRFEDMGGSELCTKLVPSVLFDLGCVANLSEPLFPVPGKRLI